MPNACFSDPRHPNLDPKTNRKNNLEIDMKILCFWFKNTQKAFRMGPRNQQKIDKIQAWTSQGPRIVSRSSQDRPRIAPGSRQDRPRVPQDAKVEAPSMPNDTHGRLFSSKVFKKMSKWGAKSTEN
jgi:hypothetical protein